MKSKLAPLSVAIIMLALPVLCFASSQEDYGDYWVSVYGALSEADYPLVSRVQQVFDRVMAAADKRGNRFPKLVILRYTGEPWAISLKDGTVLLTQKAVEICYQDADKTTGDARMAFVLGHELAHLAKDDFWHIAAFETVQKFSSDQQSARELLELLQKTENVINTAHAREIIKKKELEADSYGLLYASMAGYDPKIIVDNNGKNFFREWAGQIIGELAYTDDFHPDFHPDPGQRATFLLSNMKSVSSDLDIFHLGARLCQLGRHEDALVFLNAFKEKFPCREVFNNIGLIHYQVAIKAMAGCSREKAYQYRLSTILDRETRAERFRAACGKAMFKQAIRHLKLACEKDSLYSPARVNLSSAFIMAGRYSEAMTVLDEVLKTDKDDPKAMNNRAIAMYLLGPSIKVDMFQQASETLRYVIRKYPDFSDPYYNLGRIQAERERNAGFRHTWKKYLDLESEGVHADIARDALGIKRTNAGNKKPYELSLTESVPVRPGDINEKTEKQLAKLTRHPLELGGIFGDYYSGDGILVLVMNAISRLNKL